MSTETTKVKATDFRYERFELELESGTYVLELDNESIFNGDRLYPLNSLTSKGMSEQLEMLLHIFTLKNHKHVNTSVIRKLAREIIEAGKLEDIMPVLTSEYVSAYEKVFTSKGADTKKKVSFKKI